MSIAPDSPIAAPDLGTEALQAPGAPRATAPVLSVLAALSFSHLLNDAMQSLIPAIYPILKSALNLDFVHIGLISLTNQLTASVLQPLVGFYTDRRPHPFSLAIGMSFTLAGLALLSFAGSLTLVLVAVALVGIGSSVFHPEASRIAHIASGGRLGFAQSFFQVGGNAGAALGPLLAAVIVVARGQSAVLWFSLLALVGIAVLTGIGRWYRGNLAAVRTAKARAILNRETLQLTRGRVVFSLAILVVLIFSKYFYLASMSSYYTFFLMEKFGLSVKSAQLHLFGFLFAVAAGTLLGGPVGDRIGRKSVIWASILGVAPFALALPHANLFWVGILTAIIGLILASAFSAILVYAQELVPGRVGLIAGLFFGLAFGLGGIGSAVLGALADRTSIPFVFQVCSYLPLIGLLTWLLPSLEKRRRASKFQGAAALKPPLLAGSDNRRTGTKCSAKVSMRVLIADDQKGVGTTLAALVSKCDHEVVEVVGSGFEAIQAYHRHRPDIVLMDYYMPHLNGATACRNILSRYPAANVILVSGVVGAEELSHSGAIAVLAKPIDLARLKILLAAPASHD